MYSILGLDRNSDQDDWPQGLKDRDKATGKIRIKGFSAEVAGRDIVIFEDMVGSGGTACDSATLLKSMGARSVSLFATSGLFTTDIKNGDAPTASVERINDSKIDAVFITDTLDHSLTDPAIQEAIEASSVIHVFKTTPFLASIIRALHMVVAEDTYAEQNSVSALLKGIHPDQTIFEERLAHPTPVKNGNSLIKLLRS